MFDKSSDKQANEVRQNALAPKEPEQAAERRRLEDALEDDEVNEALKSLRARKEVRSGTEPNRS